jgi:tetratricopeptide (TPR) repeat protein
VSSDHMDESIIQNPMELFDSAQAEKALVEIDGQLRSSADSKERARLLLGKSVLYGVLRRFRDSRQQLDMALAQGPDDPDFRLELDFISGTLYDQEEKPSEAFAQLTRTLSNYRKRLMQPDLRFMYEDIQLRRGLDAARIGQHQEAASLLRESLSYNLKSEDRSIVLANLGLCEAHLEHYESARDCLLEACKLGQTKEWEGQVHFYLGLSYAHLSLFREAKREFQLCEEHLADYGFPTEKIFGWLSWVCKGLGEEVESQRYATMGRRT